MDQIYSFGEWLRQRRAALDLTRAELAERAGCSVSALRKIESDERRPSKQLAALLGDCLGISIEDRPSFIQAARGQLRVDRLGPPARAVCPGQKPPAHPFNLPSPLTALVGRESELATLGQLLRDPQCRLLTVVGPGGIGKTRLALEVAARHREVFADGGCFASLAALNSSAFIVPAIANALGFEFQGQVEPRIQLLNYLRARQALLVMDNVEHLLDGVGLFAELLERASEVKLLVTSRETLNLQGEWVFELQGLPVPPTHQADGAEDYSAVALFVQCAQRVHTGFELSAEERASVVHICQMVEGMPLGIELAAAWVSVLSSREIAREIERSLDFLATSKRDVPERQRSLRAAFDHSWSLLTADERRVFTRLAIFQGGFEREAAEQVAGANLPLLLALASKSLVHRDESGRYGLHEVVRQYAQEYLVDDAQGEAVRDRHCGFFLTLLRDREAALKSSAQRETLRELTDEIDNVRAAWAWAVKREKFTLLGKAMRCFGWLFEMRGWFREGVEQVEFVVEPLRGRSDNEGWLGVLGQALAQQGLLLFRQGQFDRAQALFDESLDILRPIGGPALLLDPLLFSGIIMFLWGETDRAQSVTDECLACARAVGDRWFEAYALYNVGFIASLQGRYAEAYEQMLAALAMWRALGDPRHTALGLNWISPTAIKLGQAEQAQAFLRESLALCTQVGDRWGMGTAHRHLGLAALAQGDIAEAQSHIQKSLDLFAGFITGWDVVQSCIYLGDTAATDVARARAIYLDALYLAKEAKATSLVLDILVRLADLGAQAGESVEAAALSTYVLSHAASTQEAKERAERLHDQLASQLTAQQIEAAHARVQARSLDALGTELLEG